MTSEELTALRDAKPTTEFERVAESINVDVVSWNGGIHYRVTLFEVLKYPTAFSLETLKVLETSTKGTGACWPPPGIDALKT